LAAIIARSSSVFHHSTMPLSMLRRHLLSVFCSSSGSKARKVTALSPTMLTSIGSGG